VLLPVVPYSLEMLALRRLTVATFGTLMALEPAIALVLGLVVLHQVPGWSAIAGIGLVVAAGIGAERTGARPLVGTGNRSQPLPIPRRSLQTSPPSPARARNPRLATGPTD
jgi:inner membrane transporter RhtA